MSTAFLVLVLYLALQFGLGIYISTKVKSEADYFVAGRGFSLGIVAVSLFATWFGAETTIGSSGAVYAEGLSGSRADPFGYGLCLVLCGYFIASKIWDKESVTLSDFYRERYGVWVEQLGVWILSISSLIWAAAQLRAFGQVISATTDFDLNTTIALGFFCVVAYTLLGGLIGDMITDVIQAFVIGLGLLILVFVVVQQNPNWSELIEAQPLERFSLRGAEESWWMRVERWAIPILGSLVAQEVIARLFSANSKRTAVRACYLGAGLYLLFGSIPVFLGMLGPELLVVDGESEQFLIQLAKAYLSPVLYGLFLGAIISALLATIDSILLAVGALVGHNFLIPQLGIKSEKAKLILSRSVVMGAGVIVYGLAVHSTGIYDLLETASSFGTSGILVITVLGLWTSWGGQKSAFFTLVAGMLATPFAEHVLDAETPFIISVCFALVTFSLLSFFKRKKNESLA